jgi:hypothetical protein
MATIGTVLITFRFSIECPQKTSVNKYEVSFFFPTAAMSVIIGRSFLIISRIMTALRSRLSWFSYRPKPVCSHFIQAIGQPCRRLLCTLNGRKALALPDSGADLNLISCQYAGQNEL